MRRFLTATDEIDLSNATLLGTVTSLFFLLWSNRVLKVGPEGVLLYDSDDYGIKLKNFPRG